jgi:hypothetical protein
LKKLKGFRLLVFLNNNADLLYKRNETYGDCGGTISVGKGSPAINRGKSPGFV